MLSEWWEQVAFLRKTLSVWLRTTLYRTNSIHSWLNNDWTLWKRCYWWTTVQTILLTWNVIRCLYILQKLWQVSYKQQLKELPSRVLETFTCFEENLTKNIHWLCSESSPESRLYEPVDNHWLFKQEGDIETLQQYVSGVSGWDLCMTILLSTQLVNSHSVKSEYSVCQQSLKENLSAVKDCMKSLYCLSLRN